MRYNKSSILSQLGIVEENTRRLKTLIEADLAQFDTGVPAYCCTIIITQTDNIYREIYGKKLTKHDELDLRIAIKHGMPSMYDLQLVADTLNKLSIYTNKANPVNMNTHHFSRFFNDTHYIDWNDKERTFRVYEKFEGWKAPDEKIYNK